MNQKLRRKIYYFDFLLAIQLSTVFLKDFFKKMPQAHESRVFTLENLVSFLIFIFLYKTKTQKEGTKLYSFLTIIIQLQLMILNFINY
jgi:hypothetical protein